jgi:hypothetical protein
VVLRRGGSRGKREGDRLYELLLVAVERVELERVPHAGLRVFILLCDGGRVCADWGGIDELGGQEGGEEEVGGKASGVDGGSAYGGEECEWLDLAASCLKLRRGRKKDWRWVGKEDRIQLRRC